MRKKRHDPPRRNVRTKRNQDIKSIAIREIRTAGLDKEITESLIKEIKEICAFEDSLEEF